MAKKARIPHKFLPWIDARKNFKLSDVHIQMARELGLSPKRFGKYANRKDEPWKLPLPQFIETLYEKQFGKTCPDEVRTMEQLAAEHVAKRTARKAEKERESASEVSSEAVAKESSETVVEESSEVASEDASDAVPDSAS